MAQTAVEKPVAFPAENPAVDDDRERKAKAMRQGRFPVYRRVTEVHVEKTVRS
jgi:hypothetical protein